MIWIWYEFTRRLPSSNYSTTSKLLLSIWITINQETQWPNSTSFLYKRTHHVTPVFPPGSIQYAAFFIAGQWLSGCMAFTNTHRGLQECLYCKESRCICRRRSSPRQKKVVRQQFLFFPLIPRFQLQYSAPTGKRAHDLREHWKYMKATFQDGTVRGVFDGHEKLFREFPLWSTRTMTSHWFSLYGMQATNPRNSVSFKSIVLC